MQTPRQRFGPPKRVQSVSEAVSATPGRPLTPRAANHDENAPPPPAPLVVHGGGDASAAPTASAPPLPNTTVKKPSIKIDVKSMVIPKFGERVNGMRPSNNQIEEPSSDAGAAGVTPIILRRNHPSGTKYPPSQPPPLPSPVNDAPEEDIKPYVPLVSHLPPAPPLSKLQPHPPSVPAEGNFAAQRDATSPPVPTVGATVVIAKRRVTIFSQIGKGGSSSVFCASMATSSSSSHDFPLPTNNNNTSLDSGSSSGTALIALKHVTGKEHVACLREEVELLRKLREIPATRPHIVQYLGHEFLGENDGYLMLELGQNDLSQFLVEEKRNNPGCPSLSRHLVRYLWESMLDVVNSIHEARIVHGDLKPANFIFVRGKLKLIDFGIAKGIPRDDTVNITRDTQTGTLNYIPPEALLPASGPSSDGGSSSSTTSSSPLYKLSVRADVWSLGCILYSLVYGAPPFQDVVPWARKVAAILNQNHAIRFPPTVGGPNNTALPVEPALLDVLARCLQRNPASRPTIAQLKTHAYLTGLLPAGSSSSSVPSGGSMMTTTTMTIGAVSGGGTPAKPAMAATPRAVAELIKEMAMHSDDVARLGSNNAKPLAARIVKNLATSNDVAKAVQEAIAEMQKASAAIVS